MSSARTTTWPASSGDERTKDEAAALQRQLENILTRLCYIFRCFLAALLFTMIEIVLYNDALYYKISLLQSLEQCSMF